MLRKKIDHLTLFDDQRLDESKLSGFETNFSKYKQITNEAIQSLQEQIQNILQVSSRNARMHTLTQLIKGFRTIGTNNLRESMENIAANYNKPRKGNQSIFESIK